MYSYVAREFKTLFIFFYDKEFLFKVRLDEFCLPSNTLIHVLNLRSNLK